MIQSKTFTYHDDTGLAFKGYYAFDANQTLKKPLILVIHDWSGCTEFACHKAEKLAQLGYVGFAIDMYGHGKIGKTNEEKMALMKTLKENRPLLLQRMHAALKAAQTNIPQADITQLGAIGFCFGGLCALDLARSGAAMQAAVCFHGTLLPPPNFQPTAQTIQAKILVLHGFDDPMVPPQQVIDFADSMTRAKAQWQIVMYGHTMHSFTNPAAHNPDSGMVYQEDAAREAWASMERFLAQTFQDSRIVAPLAI